MAHGKSRSSFHNFYGRQGSMTSSPYLPGNLPVTESLIPHLAYDLASGKAGARPRMATKQVFPLPSGHPPGQNRTNSQGASRPPNPEGFMG